MTVNADSKIYSRKYFRRCKLSDPEYPALFPALVDTMVATAAGVEPTTQKFKKFVSCLYGLVKTNLRKTAFHSLISKYITHLDGFN